MKKILFIFALTGWTISLMFHLKALILDYNTSRQFLIIWFLGMGIFVVWLPTVLITKSNNALKELRQNNTPGIAKHKQFFKTIFGHTPTWLIIIAAIGAIHAAINFIIIAITIQSNTPEIKGGEFILQNHGHFIKKITEMEYNHYSALQLMLFTGHFIAFYGIVAAVLYPYKTSNQTIEN
jgi:hypothetical protein